MLADVGEGLLGHAIEHGLGGGGRALRDGTGDAEAGAAIAEARLAEVADGLDKAALLQ